jgi:hypothetical protein
VTAASRAAAIGLVLAFLTSASCGPLVKAKAGAASAMSETLFADRLSPDACAPATGRPSTIRLSRGVVPAVQPSPSSCWAATLEMAGSFYGGNLRAADYVARLRRRNLLLNPATDELFYHQLFTIPVYPLYARTPPPPGDLALAVASVNLSAMDELRSALSSGSLIAIVRELASGKDRMRHMLVVDTAVFARAEQKWGLQRVEGVDPAYGERFCADCATLVGERAVAFRIDRISALRWECRRLRASRELGLRVRERLAKCDRFGF